MTSRVHLNTAGAGLPAPGVLDAMSEYLAAEAALGPYEAEASREEDLTRTVYQRLARLIGASPDEVALFGSATDAWCRAVCTLELPAGSRIWTGPYEYAGNLIALQELCRRRRCTLEVVPALPGGDLDLDWMRAELDERVALVSMVYLPSGMGVVQPVAEIGALLRDSAAVYVVDACQAVGQLPIDVATIGCHVLTAAGRKFLRGPRGSGFGYLRRDLWPRIRPPFHDLHVAEVRSRDEYDVDRGRAIQFETAERSNAVVLGLLAAAEHALSTPDGATAEVYDALVAAVAEIPGTVLLAPGENRAGILSFVHDRVTPDAIRDGLAAHGVTAWVGVGAHTPLYLPGAGVDRFVRTSVHHYTTLEQIAVFRAALRTVLG
ncbi:aminotransferase class V-fold PLP-dependent enzyme [Amycolatopsis sp. NPDC059021]|uniref:aminotransferase class V-fold PLP-dependent enzyme n=1 Tax=Amycolatopsis sp. NPDC059021 TaxID=3346704 RepID=UPI0036713231